VPGVEDFAGSSRKEQKAHDGQSVGPEARLIAVENPAAADDPGRMLATAPERPQAGNAVAPIHDHGLPGRPKRAAGDHQRVAAVDFARRVRRQIDEFGVPALFTETARFRSWRNF
jgi:hypothetical protein